MCVEGCQEAVKKALSRRSVLVGLSAGASTLSLSSAPASAQQTSVEFSRIVDLTHTLDDMFPTFGGTSDYVELEQVFSAAEDGYDTYKWHIIEHVGTHLDAPSHFSADGRSAAELPIGELVVPLAKMDVRQKAVQDPDYELSVQDLLDWEAEHGSLPNGCCVAMDSGWSDHVATDRFRNADETGAMHFPGIHPDTAAFLLAERNVVGLAVDTLSLDNGRSTTFGTHVAWLPSNRWGLECVANLSEVPASGATLVVGGPKIAKASGGPSRVLALV